MEIILIMYNVLHRDSAHQIENKLNLNDHTVADWGMFCRVTVLKFFEGSTERPVVLIRLSRLTTARSVGESTVEGALFRVSGCLVVSNKGLVEHFLFPYWAEPPTR